ncbi:acetyltransferase [Vibrio anguillarum]|nr:acetyltransferase [Vibrio anguillarum]
MFTVCFLSSAMRCQPLSRALCSSTGSTETKKRQPNVFELTELYSFCL